MPIIGNLVEEILNDDKPVEEIDDQLERLYTSSDKFHKVTIDRVFIALCGRTYESLKNK